MTQQFTAWFIYIYLKCVGNADQVKLAAHLTNRSLDSNIVLDQKIVQLFSALHLHFSNTRWQRLTK